MICIELVQIFLQRWNCYQRPGYTSTGCLKKNGLNRKCNYFYFCLQDKNVIKNGPTFRQRLKLII
jgi:hypothetical protein